MGKSIWQHMCCAITFCFVIWADVSFAASNGAVVSVSPEESKCDELLSPKKDKGDSSTSSDKKDDTFVIWEPESDSLYPCSSSKSKRKKLSTVLKELVSDKAAKTEFLKFKTDSRIVSLDTKIPFTVVKVKEGKNLKSLASKAYGASLDFSKITGSPIDYATQEIVSEGYVFFRAPKIQIEKNCVIGVFPDGFAFTPRKGKDNTVKKNCILRTIPLHFKLVPLSKIHHPVLSVKGGIVDEGELLKFEVTKQGEQTLAETFSYKVFTKTESDDDYTEVSQAGTRVFQPEETTKFIEFQTTADERYEADEKISLQVFYPRNSSGTPIIANGTIKNDDPKATVSVKGDAVKEGDALDFIVRREPGSSNEPFSLGYNIVGGSADSSDFEQSSGRIDFATNDAEKVIKVKTYVDELREGQEALELRLLEQAEIEFTTAKAIGSISDGTVIIPKSGPFNISDASSVEGDDLTFTVSRAPPFDKAVAMRYQATGDVIAEGVLEFVKGEGRETFSLATPENDIWEEDKKTQLTIKSQTSDVILETSTAIGRITEKTVKPSCDTEGSYIPIEQVDARINEASIDVEHKNLFSLKGTAASCHYLAFSMNGYFVIDAQAYQLVTTRADINGKWSWDIISGGDNAETRFNLRQAAIETKSEIEAERGSSAPLIAYTNHFSDDANIFEVYSNQESIDRDTIPELLNFNRLNHLSKTDNISLVTEEEGSACSIKSVEFKLPKISTEQRIRNSSSANIKLNPSEREDDKCGLFFSFQNLNKDFEHVFVVTKKDKIIYQEDLAEGVKTQFVPIPNVPNPYRFFIAKKIVGTSISCDSNKCEQGGVAMESLAPMPSGPTSNSSSNTDPSRRPREPFKPDPRSLEKSSIAESDNADIIDDYPTDISNLLSFKSTINIKPQQQLSEPTKYLYNVSSDNNFIAFFRALKSTKIETNTAPDEFCLQVTTAGVDFPKIEDGKERKCVNVGEIESGILNNIDISGRYDRTEFAEPFDVSIVAFLKPYNKPLGSKDTQQSFVKIRVSIWECWMGDGVCTPAQQTIPWLIMAVIGLISLWPILRPVWERYKSSRTSLPTDGTPSSSNNITSAWLRDFEPDFSYLNTQNFEKILRKSYKRVSNLRHLAQSTGLKVGEIKWEQSRNKVAREVIIRASVEGKLVILIAVMLRDTSVQGVWSRLRKLLDEEAENEVNQEILNRQGGNNN